MKKMNAVSLKKTMSLLLLLFIGCQQKDTTHGIALNKNVIQINKFPEELQVSFQNLFEYKEGVPGMIHVLDSSLIIQNKNRNSESIFYRYSLSNNKLTEGGLSRGRGPGEALGVSTSGLFNNKLWALDITQKKVLISDTKITENNSFENTIYNEYQLGNDDFYYKINFVDSLNVLGVSLDYSNLRKLEKIDLLTNKRTGSLGQFYKVPKNIPIGSVKDAYSAEIYVKPSKDKVVLAYNYTDAIEIFDLKDGNSVQIKGPDLFDVHFTIENKKEYYYMGGTRDTQKAFTRGGGVTNKYIYLLYSGYKREDRSEESRYLWNHAKYIYVYDWDGKPIKKIILDTYVNSLGVSKDGKTIYSFNPKTGFIIKAKI